MSNTVIHDLGFRHYDGDRLGRRWILRSLVVDTVRGAFGLGRPAKAKVMPWILVAIMMMPALVSAIALFLVGATDLLIDYRIYPMAMALVVTLFVGARAPYAVSRDLRDGVMPLYLSRPLKSSDYAWAKFLGLTIAVFMLLALPQTFSLAAALLAKLPPGGHFSDWLAGLAVSLLVAALFSGIALVMAAFTPRRGLGIAAIVATLMILSALALILSDLIGWGADGPGSGDTTLAAYLAAVDPMLIVNGIAVAWLESPGVDAIHTLPGAGPGLFFASLYAVVLSGCIALLMRRYKKVGGA
jgi:ABC-2 type transport system permease protein